MNVFAAYVGIDWSDQKHDLSLIDAATGWKESSILSHSPEAIDKWATELRTRFPGQKLAVCLEQSRGPLLFALLKCDFLVLYPINPSTLARYREAFLPQALKMILLTPPTWLRSSPPIVTGYAPGCLKMRRPARFWACPGLMDSFSLVY